MERRIDELNAFVGLARSSWENSPIGDELHQIQTDLFEIGSQLGFQGTRLPLGRPARTCGARRRR